VTDAKLKSVLDDTKSNPFFLNDAKSNSCISTVRAEHTYGSSEKRRNDLIVVDWQLCTVTSVDFTRFMGYMLSLPFFSSRSDSTLRRLLSFKQL